MSSPPITTENVDHWCALSLPMLPETLTNTSSLNEPTNIDITTPLTSSPPSPIPSPHSVSSSTSSTQPPTPPSPPPAYTTRLQNGIR